MKNEMWLIWKEAKSRRRYKIGTLSECAGIFTFQYINPELDDAKKHGFEYFPGFDVIDQIYTSDKLFSNISTRLPNLNRPDYLEILNSYNLDKDSTEFDILKATKGRLVTDNYEFVPAFDKNKIEFEVAGTRHYSDVEKCYKLLKLNSKLYLEMEPDNQYDKYAIKVIFIDNNKRYHLGYVPRYYSKELTHLLNEKYEYSAMIKGLRFKTQISDESITADVKLIFNI